MIPAVSDALRGADWLDAPRAARFARVWLVISILAITLLIVGTRHLIDPFGRPFGADFLSFWTASRIALLGRPALVYDVTVHQAAQTALLGHPVDYSAFFYPPVFLLICLPLALLPYAASLALWMATTGGAYVAVVRRWFPEGGWLAALAFPAVFINLGNGQNGFLSGALFGGGALLLGRRPFLAGALMGGLVYKPHLGLVIPIALIAWGRWKALAGAAASSMLLCLAATLAFGSATWRGFLRASALARHALEANLVGNQKMQSLFAAVRLFHGGLGLAYLAQILLSSGACVALILAGRKARTADGEGPALIAATLLCSPFLLDYDLTLLAFPLAWLASRGLRSGFQPWEKAILAAGFLLPGISRPIATAFGLPLAPLVLLTVFCAVLRRWMAPSSSADLTASRLIPIK